MSLHYVPEFRMRLDGIEYLNYGNQSVECELVLAVDLDAGEIDVVSCTESGVAVCHYRLDEATARTLHSASTQPPETVAVPGLTRSYAWGLSGRTVGAEIWLELRHLGYVGEWLAFALGDKVWDRDELGDDYEV